MSAAIDAELLKLPADAPMLALKADVTQLQNDVQQARLDGAPHRIDALETRFRQLLGGSRQSTAAEADADAATAGAVFLDGWLPPAPWRELSAPGASKTLHWRQRFVGLLATLLIAVLAVLLGLRVLWAGDWTWGGPQAYLIAFLWGAGLHQFTYEGLSGLIDREKW